jgi:hypothetical protein
MNRHFLASLIPLTLLSPAVVPAEPQFAKPAPLDAAALDNVTAGGGTTSGDSTISIQSGGSSNITSYSSSSSSVTIKGSSASGTNDGVSVSSKTINGKTEITYTYTEKGKDGKPHTVTVHRTIPGTGTGTGTNVSITKLPGQKPVVTIGKGPAGVYINQKSVHPIRHPAVVHKLLVHPVVAKSAHTVAHFPPTIRSLLIPH